MVSGFWRGVVLLTLAGALAGCAAAKQSPMPAELPLLTIDQIFRIRWALQQEPGAARAVGQIEYDIDRPHRIMLAFFGLDAKRRIVSRTSTQVRSVSTYPFTPIPFSMQVVPTGRETSFEVRVLQWGAPGNHPGPDIH